MTATSGRGVRGIRTVLALLLVLVALQTANVRTASAATSVTFAAQTLGAAKAIDAGHRVTALGTVSWNFTATQTAYVVSVGRVNSATWRILFDNEVRCVGPNGWTKNMVIGQNVLAAGTAPHDDIQLTTRFLVHPGTAGTVTCTTYARTVSLRDYSGDTLKLVSGSLRFADFSVGNTTSGTPVQASVSRTIPLSSTSPTVREPATGMFDMPAGTTGLSVFGDTEFQVNCTKTECGIGDTTTARFTLIVNQWTSTAGAACPDSARSVSKLVTANYSVHHSYIPLNIPDFAVKTGSGCIPRFNAYVKVDWVGGMTGGVQGIANGLYDGSGTSGPTHSSDMSHIFAVPY